MATSSQSFCANWNVVGILVTLFLIPKGCEGTAMAVKTGTLVTTADTVSVTVVRAGTATDDLAIGGVTIEDDPQSVVDFQPQVDTKLATATGNGITISATGLSPYSPYKIKITGGTTDGSAALGTPTLDTTFCTMAGMVTALAVDDATTETTIKLTWTAPTGPAPNEYVVKIGDYEQTVTTTEIVIDKLDADGTALTAGTDYACQVVTKHTAASGTCTVADNGTSDAAMITCSTEGGSDDDKECSAASLGWSKLTILAIIYGLFRS